ncbi:zinc ribbon domain-containing protein [bacterium]|nr:MAG: zinc ribbon domain-containing protein [bacterium]RKZ15039.1 MAG: zinc ribbon domain-containing protein [bacterium]
MPLYDYLCDDCGKKFEEFRSIADRKTAPCPVCGKPADKQISSFFTSSSTPDSSGSCGNTGFG